MSVKTNNIAHHGHEVCDGLPHKYVFDRQSIALDPTDPTKILILGCQKEHDWRITELETIHKMVIINKNCLYFLIYDTQRSTIQDLSNSENISTKHRCFYVTIKSTQDNVHIIADWQYERRDRATGQHFVHRYREENNTLYLTTVLRI